MPSLYVANKNYSSWSLRPWLLMRGLNIAFDEHLLYFSSEAFSSTLAGLTPAGRVPVLVDNGLVIWDSLAIVEYLAERFPDAGVWPADRAARARARSICAEMHAGFGSLRSQMPMNLEAKLDGYGWNTAVQKDISRIISMWAELLEAHKGPFLFGAFCAADAYYAPVVTRFQTYGVQLPRPCAEYAHAIRALPAMIEWTEAACAEHRFVAIDEPYREPVNRP